MVLLLLAKLATMAVPFTFKWATDALAGVQTPPAGGSAMAVLGHGGARRHDSGLWRRRAS